ncbi:hypothetical protein [Streptomyces halobius]|uniref:Asparagine synthase n=1 Tax=Streptomyces halobius TaxID=2879846 RepID=A0ABY4M6T2_9ACTN|nr:hypothetical protein [Streptomyces halobius]UQA93383.1 hypothetical protein K9S39_17390 [Streptomyces halobius]
MDDAVDVRPIDCVETVLHLTGGFDSGTVGTRLAERYPNRFPTAALLIAGPGRAHQIHRRSEFIKALPFAEPDHLIDAIEHPPLSPACARVKGERISPYEEPLHRPFTKLTEDLADHGARVVVTRLGGDAVDRAAQEGRAWVRRGCHFPELVRYNETQGFNLVHEVQRTHTKVYLMGRRAERIAGLEERFRAL